MIRTNVYQDAKMATSLIILTAAMQQCSTYQHKTVPNAMSRALHAFWVDRMTALVAHLDIT